MRSLLPLCLLTSLTSALWPKPVSYENGKTVLFIAEDVPFNWYQTGTDVRFITDQVPFLFASKSNPGSASQNKTVSLKKTITQPASSDGAGDGGVSGDDIVNFAISSTWQTLFKRNLYPWKFHPRSWSEPKPDGTGSVSRIDVKVLSANPDSIGKPLAGEVDESYSLTLTEDGVATINANSSVGAAHGLTTLTQLFFAHSDKQHVYTNLAPVKITDSPKFQHRGINLDTSRAAFSVDDVKRQIDACAYNKMNRFHLHVTDSQSWPLEVPSIPELSAKGAYRPDLVFTASDFQTMQRYAAIQGVQMITEIDMPGHTASIAYSFPDLITAFNIQPNWDTYAAEPPTGTLKLNSPKVSEFLNKLLDDVLPRVSPYAAYFHTGGDEVNKNAYNLDDTVKSNDTAVLQPLMQKFVDRNHDQVRKLGLTPVVWEEMLLDWNVTLGKDVIVQSWQSDAAVAQITAKGHKVLVGNYNYWYLDCGKGQWLNFDPSMAASSYPYQDYCAPFHNWRLIYSYDPLAGVAPENQHLVLGGEAHMWSEQTDPINVDRMIWPRAAAAAEILWSGAKDEQDRNRSQIDAAPRLSEMRERLVMRGVGAEPIQMPYCTMEGTVCQLGFSGSGSGSGSG
ncbi:Beta-hexosaminidase [Pyrenophora teres f. maculata]|nr:Beta-hexosaminidase [Pyrenophora teres f. maculata]